MKSWVFSATIGLALGSELLLGRASAQTGPGNALDFDGISAFVLAPAVPPSGVGFTVEAWVKPSNLTRSCEQVIVQQGFVPAWAPHDFQLKFWGCGTLLHFNWRVASGGQGDMGISVNPGDFNDGNWHHIAATYDAVTTRAIYRDGAKISEVTSGGYYPTAFYGGNVTIGAAFDGTNASAFYGGGIDEVRIWSRARSAEEICQTLNERLVGNEPDLAAYWRLDEGIGSSAFDSSGHGLTGILSNAPTWIPSASLRAIPVVTTVMASNLVENSVVLAGSASVCGLATSAWFEYGTNSDYGQSTTLTPVGSGNDLANFTQFVANLIPDTIYHYRAVAQNAGGRGVGGDQQFKTAGAPKPSSLPATEVNPNAATINASIDPDGLSTTAWFEWGPTTNYGTATSLQQLADTNSISRISSSITSLVPGQIYHFRAVATNHSGIGFSRDQPFTPAFSNSFSGSWTLSSGSGSVGWGDYDRNGYLDLLASGGGGTNVQIAVYRNDAGSLHFVPDPSGFAFNSAGLPVVQQGVAIWGDFDNDGALDVLLTGYSAFGWNGKPTCQVYRNANGLFTPFGPPLAGVWKSFAAVGDYNNDGFLDFVVTGITNSDFYSSDPVSPITTLYRNKGDGTFTDMQAGLPAVFDGAVAWGDFDNDGQLDLVLMGNTGTSNITRIYRNDHGVFADIGANLPGLCCGSLAWGDYDNDGQSDLLLVGQTNSDPGSVICRIYRNDHRIFTDIAAGLPGVSSGAAAWGDYDGDGYLDILLVGHDAAMPNPYPWMGQDTARVFRNDHGQFTDIQTGLGGLNSAGVAWGDYDNDGRLDVAVLGAWSGLRVYRNFVPQPTSNPFAPQPPGAPSSTVVNDGVTLRWKAGSDAHTPNAGLTYNLRVGTTPGGMQIISPQSNLATGRRSLPQIGSAEHRLFATLTNLSTGLYYWSVQTVNNSFAGSPWAAEQSFTVTNGGPGLAPRVLRVVPQPGMVWLLEFTGTPATVYVLEGSTNLFNWLALTNLLATADGTFQFLDKTATNLPARYYRLRSP